MAKPTPALKGLLILGIGIAIFLTVIFIVQNNPPEFKQGKCFDSKGSEVIGQQCLVNQQADIQMSLFLIILISLSLIVIGLCLIVIYAMELSHNRQ